MKNFRLLLSSLLLISGIYFSTFCSAQVYNYRNYWKNSGLFKYSYFYSNSEKRAAQHETAHALAAALLGVYINEVTIIPTSQFRSYVNFTYHNPLDAIKVFLAGYAAEKIIYGKASYGACIDLDKVVEIAFQLNENNDSLSPQSSVVLAFLKNQLDETTKILTQNRDLLDKLTQELLEKKTLSGKDVYDIVNSKTSPKTPDPQLTNFSASLPTL